MRLVDLATAEEEEDDDDGGCSGCCCSGGLDPCSPPPLDDKSFLEDGDSALLASLALLLDPFGPEEDLEDLCVSAFWMGSPNRFLNCSLNLDLGWS